MKYIKKGLVLLMSTLLLSGCATYLIKDIKEVNRQIESAYEYRTVLKDEIVAMGYANDESMKNKLIVAGKQHSYVLDSAELLQILKSFDINNLMLIGSSGTYVGDTMDSVQKKKYASNTYIFKLEKLNNNRSFQSKISIGYFKPTKDLNEADRAVLSKFSFSCSTKNYVNSSQLMTHCYKSIDLKISVAQRVNNLDRLEYKFDGERYIDIWAKKTRYGDIFFGYLTYPLVVVGDLVVLPFFLVTTLCAYC